MDTVTPWADKVRDLLSDTRLTADQKVIASLLAMAKDPLSRDDLSAATGLASRGVDFHLRGLIHEGIVQVKAEPDYERQVFVKTFCVDCEATDLSTPLADTIPSE